MTNYILSDFISRLNVARKNKLKTIIIKPSKIILELLKIFESLGIIRGYFITNNYKIEVFLKYNRSKCVFTNLKVLSKPSKRIYVDLENLHKLKEKYPSDILLLSTSNGLMLDIECLKKKRGGLVLLRISV